MKTIRSALILLLFTSIASFLQAEEVEQAVPTPDFPKPTKEHEWLKQFEGEWVAHSKSIATPDQPSIECQATISNRMLGEFWVVSESKGEVGGGKMLAIQQIGYDPKTKKYIGTWIDNVMNHLWHYEGSVDESGKKLSLVAEGPNFMEGGKITKFRDSYEFKSPDLIVSTAEILDAEGNWVTFMTGETKRKK